MEPTAETTAAAAAATSTGAINGTVLGVAAGPSSTGRKESASSAAYRSTAVVGQEVEPRDRYSQVYWIIFLVGINCMMPWDMLVTVNGYWDYKFRNESLDDVEYAPSNSSGGDDYDEDEEPPLTNQQKMFESYLSIASSVPSAITVIIHAFVGNRFSVNGRAVLSLIGLIVTFTGIIVLAYLDSDDWMTAFMASNLVLAVIINVFRALFRATNSANMGKFPVKYMGSLANGICMGGLVPVIVNIAILSMDVDQQMAGFGCFVFACVVAVLCLALFLHMEKTDFYNFYTYLDEATVSESTGEKTGRQKVTKAVLSAILSRCWLFALTILLIGVTTSMVYPAATSLVRPIDPDEDSDWDEIYFSQVTCFLTFNVCNYLGTVCAGVVQWPGGTSMNSQVTLFLIALLRVAFIPIFMMCNLAPTDRSREVFIPNDAAFVCIMVVFSLSDGYVTNMSMMFGPKSVEASLQEVTAGILVATAATSITIGSIMSNRVVKAL